MAAAEVLPLLDPVGVAAGSKPASNIKLASRTGLPTCAVASPIHPSSLTTSLSLHPSPRLQDVDERVLAAVIPVAGGRKADGQGGRVVAHGPKV